MPLLIPLTIVIVFFLARSLLVLTGFLKEPILETFREYGPLEKPYLPMLPLWGWSGAGVFIAGLWFRQYSAASLTLSVMGIFMLIALGMAYNSYGTAAKWHFLLLKMPNWYHQLQDRTTRYERRRVAYMWLHLPPKLRLTYNSSDLLFLQWADFVIIATIREEEDELEQTVESSYVFGDR